MRLRRVEVGKTYVLCDGRYVTVLEERRDGALICKVEELDEDGELFEDERAGLLTASDILQNVMDDGRRW